ADVNVEPARIIRADSLRIHPAFLEGMLQSDDLFAVFERQTRSANARPVHNRGQAGEVFAQTNMIIIVGIAVLSPVIIEDLVESIGAWNERVENVFAT